MPTTSRPDLLPFALPGTIGLPYHGLVEDGTIRLPSGATATYPQPEDGSTTMVQHPKHAALNRTAEQQQHDEDHDHQWLEYALLSGVNHQIGGQELGAENFLYCDANYTWVIRLSLTSGTGSCRLRVYLTKLFGFVSETDYSFTERLLATYQWSPVNNYGSALTSVLVGTGYIATYNKTGSKAVLNIGTSASASGLIVPISTQQGKSLKQHDVVSVTISGDGSIVAGKIGTGISATISHDVTGDELYTAESISPGWVDCVYTNWYRYTTKKLFVVTPDGDETFRQSVMETSIVWTDTSDGCTGATVDISTTYIGTMSFGGVDYTNEFTFVGQYSGDMTPNNQGIATVNGVGFFYSEDTAGTPISGLGATGSASFVSTLPLVCYVAADNKQGKIITASGRIEDWDYDGWTDAHAHNAATDAVVVNESGTISYV